MNVSDQNGTVPEMPDVDLSKLEKESNTRSYSGFTKHFVTLYLLCFTLFQLYTSIVGTVPPQIVRMVHLGFAIPLSYLLYPATSKGSMDRLHPLDLLLATAFLLVAGYYLYNYDALIERIGFYTTLDIFVGAVGMLLVMEACRRVVGWPIVIIAAVFILYASWGKYMPGFLNHRGYSIKRIVSQLFFSTEGIIGSPLGVCASFVFLFILFGAFLEKTGIGQFFTDIANALAGSVPGGPAKVAVITSALQGTVSGSSVSNTVSTGSFTIPLMKSLGYRPEFAAAVEAAASTGGQIMPPIMGAAAFLISEIVGVSYIEVVKAAAIPAVLYFSGIWIMVHLEAKKLGLRGLPKDQVPHAGELLRKEGHLILPLIAIMVFLIMGFTTTRAALWGILTAIIVPYLRKSTRIQVADIASALTAGARNILGVSCACSTAGVIVGVVTMTGIGLKLGEGLTTLTSGMLIPTLFFTMITSLVLGMGVPTTANYLITATIAAPIVVRLGIPVLAAHLFSFYFGILSDVTPPVALAAYAGSAIAKSNPFKTGVIATKLAVAAFLVPYMFALNPSLILIDTTLPEVAVIAVTSVTGMIGIGAALTGYFVSDTLWYEQILLALGGVMLVYPGYVTDAIGVGLVAGIYLLQKLRVKASIAAVRNE
ncbi:TRAP transporter permease [Pyramidobacter porci]|uniref:TRAP transporter permease n=1 Tax=Pyramidobacter porci TaxID=2605789 RepID=UPI002A7645C2|nr:TRAP transporter permease [Pyramidobacter porci]